MLPVQPTADPAPCDAGETEELSGVVRGIVFRSEDTGYTVCRMEIAGQRDPATVVGACPAVWEGETLKVTGRWIRHKQHGLQFHADTMVCVVPTSARGIERYLASGMVPGIGKAMAGRLVTAFGDDTLRVIEEEPERLSKVPGIGPKRRRLIRDAWIEQKAVRDIMVFLQAHGVGASPSARIFRRYGQHSVALITENPYRLCEDIWGIGFKTADSVARSIGISPQSEVRARAGLKYALDSMTEDGHCFCLRPELLLQAQALLEIPAEVLATALERELKAGHLVEDEGRVYLPDLHEAEVSIALKLGALRRAPAPFRPIETDKAVAWAQTRVGLRFAQGQADALKMALAEKVSVITGGPGVGKTTLIRALIEIFTRRALAVRLTAPTGRAAKRMEEATGHEAKTLHRLLKYSPQTNRFEHSPANPLEGDIFIVDEVSMIDAALMHHFLRAVPDPSCVVFVGDVDQLPSVGPGNVLRDLIESGVIPFRRLETIFRQEHTGWIVQNAHRINRGEFPDVPPTGADSDFYFIECEAPEAVIENVVALVTRRIPRRFGFDPMSEIQVLTPMRKNPLGADNLNAVLQEALNPRGSAIRRHGRLFRVGDRVMQVRNNYDKDVFNGDIGRIRSVRDTEQTAVVTFDERDVEYRFLEMDELVHAYACSIHKSQGSEYPAVVVLLATQHFKLLQRNLLYTALTRGRKLVCLVGSRKAVRIAVRNNEIQLRRTGLRRRLAMGMETVPRPVLTADPVPRATARRTGAAAVVRAGGGGPPRAP